MKSLRLAWRQLAAEQGYSVVTILNLAAGFATCFVLMMYGPARRARHRAEGMT